MTFWQFTVVQYKVEFYKKYRIIFFLQKAETFFTLAKLYIKFDPIVGKVFLYRTFVSCSASQK